MNKEGLIAIALSISRSRSFALFYAGHAGGINSYAVSPLWTAVKVAVFH